MNLSSLNPTFSQNLLRNLCAVLFVLGAVNGRAAEQATAQMTSQFVSGTTFQYSIQLNNTGTTNIGTFWFSWVPGKDFLPVSPTNFVSPTNWKEIVTGGTPNDGFAIQWTNPAATPALLAPGSSLDFSFDIMEPPATLAGNSPFFPTFPIGTSFVYQGAPFSDAGFQFVVESIVPEPSSIALSAAGLLFLGGMSLMYKRRLR